MRRLCRWSTASLVAALTALAGSSQPAAADTFPPVTGAEHALTAVSGDPKAPAVVLSREAELRMMGYGIGSQVSSTLTVHTRIKILTEAGKSQGEVKILHSRSVRLQGLQGRTLLPDGRSLPLGSEAKFERRTSQRNRHYVTSVAFPGVEVGAILDLRYEKRFDSFFYLDPWYFSDELPVLHSEIVYDIPQNLSVQGGSIDPFKVGVQSAQEKTPFGTRVRMWADHLPAMPDEPSNLPFRDLATRVLLLPLALSADGHHIPLLESWADVCKLAEESYETARKKDGGAAEAAHRIAHAAGSARRDQAQALYRFVRDEIATEDGEDVFIGEDSSVQKTLAGKRGTSAEKALLLQALLREAKIDSRLVWAGDRRRGAVNPGLVNPEWFDRVLVAIDLDGQRSFLDPADRNLGFGQIAPWYEGTSAVVHDRKKPETMVLPEAPFDQNARQAVIDLALDASGRLTGTGTLVLTGQHAWAEALGEGEAQNADTWKKWLDGHFKDYAVTGVKVEESVDERRIRVSWSLRQRDEGVLGDEASLAPSRPLGPMRQPFVQPAKMRQSPILFPYPDRDEVELRLRWLEGWRIDAKPQPAHQDNAVGGLTVTLERNDFERTLVYRRRLDVKRKELGTLGELDTVRTLYATVEKSDAQTLVLVHR